MFPKEILESTPHSPGIYRMLDAKSKTLYVGKAKDLFKRLSSYARFSGSDHNKTTVMLAKVHKIDTIITRTEKEALILEASLIKKHKPKYNIILRDDKNYPLIKVTVQEEWPRVLLARRRAKDGAKYFGPYSSSSAMWSTLKLISSTFPLRKCKGKNLKHRKRPCLNHQIGKCLAPCVGIADKAEYQEHVKKVIMVLEGYNKTILTELTDQMQAAAKEMLFEKAAFIRDQIKALSSTLEKQVIVASHQRNQDVFGFQRQDAATGLTIMFIRNGIINGTRSFFLEDPYGDDGAILSQVLNQYYDKFANLPAKEILLPFQPDNIELLSEKLSDILDSKVALTIPQRGDRLKLTQIANKNAQNIFEEKEKKNKSWQSLSNSMEKKLRLSYHPKKIECLDISNISGKQAVGSLVCFEKGEPSKGNYRHYKIKTVHGPDDYAMMEEVLYRRLTRGMDEGTLPNLFVVDGGKGQLNMAIRVAGELGIIDELDWIGIAKERDSEGEKLYKPGRKNPILLPAHDPVLLHLMRIRDESHRYGVTFHRKLRNKATLTSELDKIQGIGTDRRTRLLKHFGSLRKVKEATVTELTEVSGIGPELAQLIYDSLQIL